MIKRAANHRLSIFVFHYLRKPNIFIQNNHSNPRLILTALFTSSIFCFSILPSFLINLVLSIVNICSQRRRESLSEPSFGVIRTCVGIALFCLLVMGHTIAVGLWALPTSFWITTAGLIPPCTEPLLNPKSTKTISPLFAWVFSLFSSFLNF